MTISGVTETTGIETFSMNSTNTAVNTASMFYDKEISLFPANATQAVIVFPPYSGPTGDTLWTNGNDPGFPNCSWGATVAGNWTVSAAVSNGKTLGCTSCSKVAANVEHAATTKEGDPIDIATGNLVENERDFTGGPNTGLSLTRVYNSEDGTSSTFGANWHSEWQRGLVIAGSTVTATAADGNRVIFTLSGSNFTTDPDVNSVLTATTSGSTITGYNLVTADDATEHYSATGLLMSVTTRAGRVTTLAHNGSNQLTTVTGPFGHTLTFTYTTGGNVHTMTAPNSGVYTYAYDTHNNLTSVTYPDTTVRQYVYGITSLPNSLTSIIDENANTYASWTYDTIGHALTSQHAGGADLTTVVYGPGSTNVTDARSNTHTYNFTTQFGVSKVSAITGALVPWLGNSFTYDSNGFLASYHDYDYNDTTYTHDAKGQQLTRVEASGTLLARTITTVWHATFHLPTSITEPNRVTTFTYDTNGNMLTKTVTAGTLVRTWTYTYNTKGQVLTVKDPDNHTTTYTYDTAGNLETITDALSHVTNFTSYDANGRLLSMTDPNGLITTFTYDPRGRLKTRTAGTELTSFTYDNAGNLTKVTRPDSSYYIFTYDNAHRLTGIKDTLGNSLAYTLDATSNVTLAQALNASNTVLQTRSFTYDDVNRLLKTIGALGQATVLTYDLQGNLTNDADPLYHAIIYAYDQLNRVTTVNDPNYDTITNGYDANDHVTTIKDIRDLTTTYTWNGLDEVTRIASPDSGTTTRTFDAIGDVLTSQDARGKTTTYTYDVLNRLSTTTYADRTTADFTYDQGTYGKGHLTKVTDVTGTTTWTYDIHGRVTQKQQVTGTIMLTTGYAYDIHGRLSTITYPSTKSVTLAYDTDGRVSTVTSGGTNLLSNIAYMPFGQISGWTEGSGATYTRTIDQDGRISVITISGTSGVPGTTTLTYTHDNADRVTTLAETSLTNKTFGYDPMNRLTSFNDGTSINYDYDGDYNRTSAGLTTYNYPTTSNKLSSLSGATIMSFTYDAAGNLTSDGTHTLSIDARGRMTSATVGGATTIYGINGLGQRIVKTGAGVPNGGKNEFVYDEQGHLIGEYSYTGALIEETIYLGNMPVAVLTSSASYQVDPDNINAAHIITDHTGHKVWTWDHIDFGNKAPNQNPSGLGVFPYNLRFPGQYADAETGLNYNMFRDYNPILGRYIESDPIGLFGGVNTYLYGGGNPIKNIDPQGLQGRWVIPVIVTTFRTGLQALARWCKDEPEDCIELGNDIANEVSELLKENQPPNAPAASCPVYNPYAPFDPTNPETPFGIKNPATPFGPNNPDAPFSQANSDSPYYSGTAPFGSQNPDAPFSEVNPDSPYYPGWVPISQWQPSPQGMK